MEQGNQKKCKICEQLKERILIGKFNTTDKKWADKHGKLWNGHTCPDCHRVKSKERMRVVQNVKKL